MIRRAVFLFCVGNFGSCTVSAFEELSSLAEKPPLPYSVLITGGGFVLPQSSQAVQGPYGATYSSADRRGEAFELRRLREILNDTNVFVATALDPTAADQRRIYADLEAELTPSARVDLAALQRRARRAGHDCILVVESILDGPIEARGINDRWPYTLAAWLFALGALIPDRTYESRARLRISIRDVYSGRRVFPPIVVEPGPIDLNMFERCGFWGFLQSVIVPPFFTSMDPETITGSVSILSIDRILISAVRRLKSAEVQDKLDSGGPATIRVVRAGPEWKITVTSREPISAVALQVDGTPIAVPVSDAFGSRLLGSRHAVAQGYEYNATCRVPGGSRLQVLVQTDAARISSITQTMERR